MSVLNEADSAAGASNPPADDMRQADEPSTRRRRFRNKRRNNKDKAAPTKGGAPEDTSGTARQDHTRSQAHSRPQSTTKYPSPSGGVGPVGMGFAGGKAVYSAIDLGTNNCRLLIAKPVRKGFRVIDAFSRIVRLGEGVANTGVLSQDAMDRSIEALKVCADKIQSKKVTCMRHVATEACRVASNTDEFIFRVKEEAGINLDVISTAEEAQLAVMGCQSLIAPRNKYALVFDIGGGSTELIFVKVLGGRRTEIVGWMSIPWGVVNLTETFGATHSTLDFSRYKEMIREVEAHLAGFDAAYDISGIIRRKKTQLLGTSGTVTTLASIQLNLPYYIRNKVDGAWMDSARLQELSHKIALMSYAERIAQPCIGEERADLVVAGCAILEAILNRWQFASLRVADRGIREGILRELMQVETMPETSGYRGKKSHKRQNSPR